MEVAGTAQIGVIDDGGGFFDGGCSEPIGEDRGDALVGERAELLTRVSFRAEVAGY